MFSKKFSPQTNKGRAISELQGAAEMMTTEARIVQEGFALPDMSTNVIPYYAINSSGPLRMWVGDRFNPESADTLGFDHRIARIVDFHVVLTATEIPYRQALKGTASNSAEYLDFSFMGMIHSGSVPAYELWADTYVGGVKLNIPDHGIPRFGGAAFMMVGAAGYGELGQRAIMVQVPCVWVDKDSFELNCAVVDLDNLAAIEGGFGLRAFFCSPLVRCVDLSNPPATNLSSYTIYIEQEFSLDYDRVRSFLISDG